MWCAPRRTQTSRFSQSSRASVFQDWFRTLLVCGVVYAHILRTGGLPGGIDAVWLVDRPYHPYPLSHEPHRDDALNVSPLPVRWLSLARQWAVPLLFWVSGSALGCSYGTGVLKLKDKLQPLAVFTAVGMACNAFLWWSSPRNPECSLAAYDRVKLGGAAAASISPCANKGLFFDFTVVADSGTVFPVVFQMWFTIALMLILVVNWPVNLKSQILTPRPLYFFQNGAKSGFEMCFGSQHLECWGQTRLESRIMKFTPRCVYRPLIKLLSAAPGSITDTDHRQEIGKQYIGTMLLYIIGVASAGKECHVPVRVLFMLAMHEIVFLITAWSVIPGADNSRPVRLINMYQQAFQYMTKQKICRTRAAHYILGGIIVLQFGSVPFVGIDVDGMSMGFLLFILTGFSKFFCLGALPSSPRVSPPFVLFIDPVGGERQGLVQVITGALLNPSVCSLALCPCAFHWADAGFVMTRSRSSKGGWPDAKPAASQIWPVAMFGLMFFAPSTNWSLAGKANSSCYPLRPHTTPFPD